MRAAVVGPMGHDKQVDIARFPWCFRAHGNGSLNVDLFFCDAERNCPGPEKGSIGG